MGRQQRSAIHLALTRWKSHTVLQQRVGINLPAVRIRENSKPLWAGDKAQQLFGSYYKGGNPTQCCNNGQGLIITSPVRQATANSFVVEKPAIPNLAGSHRVWLAVATGGNLFFL